MVELPYCAPGGGGAFALVAIIVHRLDVCSAKVEGACCSIHRNL
jgi:hypothetical protein